VDYLIQNGYRILDRNVHAHRYGELDILATKDGILVVIEVKYRSSGRYGDPLEAVNHNKQRRISKSALYFMAKHGYSMDVQVRFDVIAIYGDGSIRHIENAFEFQG